MEPTYILAYYKVLRSGELLPSRRCLQLLNALAYTGPNVIMLGIRIIDTVFDAVDDSNVLS
jgi:hypothetical protein